jgi:hypothetical protein
MTNSKKMEDDWEKMEDDHTKIKWKTTSKEKWKTTSKNINERRTNQPKST